MKALAHVRFLVGSRPLRHVLTLSTVVFVLGYLMIQQISPEDWGDLKLWCLGLAACLVKNVLEYVVHRWPMHKRRPWSKSLFHRHSLVHHKHFSHVRMEMRDVSDLDHVLPTGRTIFLSLVILGIFTSLLALVLGPSKACFAGVALGLSAVSSEIIHTLYHLPERHLQKAPRWFLWMREQHQTHHNPKLMRTYNFNVALPLGDWLFGTLAPKTR